MKPINRNLQLLSRLEIDVTFQNIEKLIKTSGNSSGIYETAREVLEKVNGKWEPAALYQWFDFEMDKGKTTGRILQPSGEAVQPDQPGVRASCERQVQPFEQHGFGIAAPGNDAGMNAGCGPCPAFISAR